MNGLTLMGTGATRTGTSYDTDAQAYINAVIAAGGTLSTTYQNAINTWFVNAKAAGWYTKIKLAYLYTQGTSAARDEINAVNPGTYNGTDTGSPTYNAGTLSISYNGSSQYTDTGFTPNGESSVFANSDFTWHAIHRVDTNNDTNATVGEVGGGNTYMVIQSSFVTMLQSGTTAINQAQTRNVNSLWMSSWSSSGVVNAYYNGSNIKSTSTAWGNTASRSPYIGAFHAASPGYGGASTVDFYIVGKGTMSDTEAASVYNETKTLKSVFGITWN